MKNKLNLVLASILLTGTVFAQQTPTATLTDTQTKAASDEISNGQKSAEGKFEGVPGGNPFVFCSGPRPPKRSPLSPIYDRICSDAQANQPKPPSSQ